MGIVQLPDALKTLIDQQVANGRASSDAEFLADAVQRHAEALDWDDDMIVAAANEGIADIEAGRFELIDGPEDLRRLQAELSAKLDRLAVHSG